MARLAAALCLTLPALAEAPPEHADRVIRREFVVKTSLDRAWAAWTTDEGARKFFAPLTRIEPVTGGAYEIYFLAGNPEGLRGTEGCKIQSIVPKQTLRLTWNAPPQFALRKMGLTTLVTLRFRETKPGETAIQFTQSGWGDGPEWDALYDYFSKAWDTVIAKFVKTYGADRGGA